MVLAYFISGLLFVASLLLVYNLINLKRSKDRILESLERLAATMNIEGARIQRLPTFALAGVYRTFNIVIECSIKKMDGRKGQFWRIAIPVNGTSVDRLYMQSESMEGRLRKVIDLSLATTNDGLFDSQIMLFSSDESIAKKIFGPYLRNRFLHAGYKNFTLEVSNGMAVLDIYMPLDAGVSSVRHHIEVMAELLNVVVTGL